MRYFSAYRGYAVNGLRLFLMLCLAFAFAAVRAEQINESQMQGLDEQIQNVKKDVLDIAAELNLLEEKLLFPSNTQVAFFVSLANGVNFIPDAVDMRMNGKDVAHHVYSYKEVEALQKGGVQRLYTGNVQTGEHDVQFSVLGNAGGAKKTYTASVKIEKDVKPEILEVRLTGAGIEFVNR